MFGNPTRPDSEHTLHPRLPHPPSKSLHWSRVNKLQFALWYWEVQTSGNPPLWQHGLRQTMSSILPHSPSITAPESTCLTVPLSLFSLARVSTSVTFSPQISFITPDGLRLLRTEIHRHLKDNQAERGRIDWSRCLMWSRRRNRFLPSLNYLENWTKQSNFHACVTFWGVLVIFDTNSPDCTMKQRETDRFMIIFE